VFGEMVERFHQAPSPRPVWLERETVGGLAAAEAIAVIYGWTNRIVRTGQAVLRLDAAGFATESSPLLRSMVEHVIALHWVSDEPGDAFQALVRQRQQQMKTYEQANVPEWQLSEKTRALIEELLSVETEESSRYIDNLLHTAHQATAYELGALYRAWLIETWTAHASLASAGTYYMTTGVSAFVLLGDEPQEPSNVPALVAAWTLAALDIYNRVLPNDFLTDDIAAWRKRLDSAPGPRT
jgi:hypothetical protein